MTVLDNRSAPVAVDEQELAWQDFLRGTVGPLAPAAPPALRCRWVADPASPGHLMCEWAAPPA